jgi:hypothetical protein
MSCLLLANGSPFSKMFSSAVLCFVLYSLVFLRLRGHFYFNHGHLRFRLRTSGQLGVSSREDDFARSIAKRMLSYVLFLVAITRPGLIGFADIPLHIQRSSYQSVSLALRAGLVMTSRFSGQLLGKSSTLACTII